MRANEFIVESVHAYHGTFQPTLTHFNALSHFGTLQAAEDRLKEKARREKIRTPGRIYKVVLDIKNPFVAKDFAGVHSPTHFAFDLRDRKLISQEEMLKITTLSGDPRQAPALIKKLRELGFDSIAYKNKHEDKGSTSYVILDPSQVVSVKSVEDNNQVKENFANGKKPGRKGLAKRSGVDCKQSVSKLRDIAAHSSGERQRMAHWCANMKAGKKS